MVSPTGKIVQIEGGGHTYEGGYPPSWTEEQRMESASRKAEVFFPDSDQLKVAEAIYLAGNDIAAEPVVEVAAATAGIVVPTTVIPLVTGVDEMTAMGIMVTLADELWLPGEAADLAMWRTDGVGTPGEVYGFTKTTFEDSPEFEQLEAVNAPPLVIAALKLLWALVGPMIVSMIVGALLGWLHDKIFDNEGQMDTALYYQNRLIGYTGGEVRRGQAGYWGVIGRPLKQ